MFKRKEIDNFILELEKFLIKYKEYLEFDIEPTFIAIFKANIKNRKNLGKYDIKRVLDIPFLEQLINIERMGDKGKRQHRTQFFFRKVAYGLEYICIQDISYENIFLKIANKKSTKITNQKTKDFLIPKDWYEQFLINN